MGTQILAPGGDFIPLKKIAGGGLLIANVAPGALFFQELVAGAEVEGGGRSYHRTPAKCFFCRFCYDATMLVKIVYRLCISTLR